MSRLRGEDRDAYDRPIGELVLRPRSGAQTAFPRRDRWFGSDPKGRGQGCASPPAPEPVPSPWRGGSLPTTPHAPLCHGRAGGGPARRCCARGWPGTPVRIAGGQKCASAPHVVCALRYGSKSGRGLPSNPPPANCKPLAGRSGGVRRTTRSTSDDRAGSHACTEDGGQVRATHGRHYGVWSGRVSAALRSLRSLRRAALRP